MTENRIRWLLHGNLALLVGIITVALPVSGCATILTSSKHRVLLTSRPRGAQVSVYNFRGRKVGDVLRTPAAVTLKYDYTGNGHRFEFKLPKSEAIEIRRLDSNLKKEFWGNILTVMYGGLLDWYLGTMWEPADISVNATFSADAIRREKALSGNGETAGRKNTATGNFNDIVILKNGKVYTGVKAAIVRKDVVITTSKGKTFVFPKKKVKRIIKQ